MTLKTAFSLVRAAISNWIEDLRPALAEANRKRKPGELSQIVTARRSERYEGL